MIDLAIYLIIATFLSIFSAGLFKLINNVHGFSLNLKSLRDLPILFIIIPNHFMFFSLSLDSLKDLAILCYGKPDTI